MHSKIQESYDDLMKTHLSHPHFGTNDPLTTTALLGFPVALNQCQGLQLARLDSKEIENGRMISTTMKRYVGISLQTIAIRTSEVNQTVNTNVRSLFVLT